jgi:hypothetical protein
MKNTQNFDWSDSVYSIVQEEIETIKDSASVSIIFGCQFIPKHVVIVCQ